MFRHKFELGWECALPGWGGGREINNINQFWYTSWTPPALFTSLIICHHLTTYHYVYMYHTHRLGSISTGGIWCTNVAGWVETAFMEQHNHRCSIFWPISNILAMPINVWPWPLLQRTWTSSLAFGGRLLPIASTIVHGRSNSTCWETETVCDKVWL